MTKHFFMLSLLASLSLVSCGKSGPGGSSQDLSGSGPTSGEHLDAVTGAGTPQQSVPASTITSTANVPSQALSFATNVNLIGFTPDQVTKYNKAIAIVKKVVATEAFRSRVLGFKFNGSTQFANNRGLSNAQIYQSILDAAETLTPAKNNSMDLGVKLYYASTNVIGYTNPSITYINVNTKYFNSFTADQVSGNLFHEWLHKIGYGHDSAATAQRPYSVPYAIGYIVRDLGKNFL